MSRNVSATNATHLAGGVTTLTTCWKITASDGTVRAFTSHDQAITVDSVTYSSILGYDPTALSSTLFLNVDTLDAEGPLAQGGFVRDDLLAGKWDLAVIEFFFVNYLATSTLPVGIPVAEIIKLRKGVIGEVTFNDYKFTAEIRGLTQYLSQKIVDLYSPGCRLDLGDATCGVRLSPSDWVATTSYTVRTAGDAATGSVVKPTTLNRFHYKCTTAGISGAVEPTWPTTAGTTVTDGTVVWTAFDALTHTGSVTAVTSTAPRRKFTDSAQLGADDYWVLGVVTWLTGNNAGRSMEVKVWTLSTTLFELVLPMPVDIVIGDTYSVHVGCVKDAQTACKTLYDNMINFGGEPFIPQDPALSIVTAP